MTQNFKAAIDIVARASGVASVRDLRKELERLNALSKAGLPLTGELGKLGGALGKLSSAWPALSAFAHGFTSLKDGAKSVRSLGTAIAKLDEQAKGGFTNTTGAISTLITRLGHLTSSARSAAGALNSVAAQQKAAWQSVNDSLATYITRAKSAKDASTLLRTPAVSPSAPRAAVGGGGMAGVGGLVGVAAAGAAAKQMVGAGITVQGIQATLLAANNDNAAAAGRDWDYLVQQANKYGTSLKDVGNEYARLKIAAMSAAKSRGYSEAEGELAAKRQFEAISKVSTALHLQPEATKGMIKAFEQMQSKGKVSLEELTGQLGDRLPATIALAAEAAGMESDKMLKMIEKRQLSSLEFVTLIAERISKKYETAAQKASTGMQAQFTRVNNALTLSMNSLGSAGTFDVLADSAGKLADVLNDNGVQGAINGIGLAMAETARDIVGFIASAKQFYTENKTLIDTVGKAALEFAKYALAIKATASVIQLGKGVFVGLAKDLGLVSGAVFGVMNALGAAVGFFDTFITKVGNSAKALMLLKSAMAGVAIYGGYEFGKTLAERESTYDSANLMASNQLKDIKSIEDADKKLAVLKKARAERVDVLSGAWAKAKSIVGLSSYDAEKAKANAALADYDEKIKVVEGKKAEFEKKASDAKAAAEKASADAKAATEKEAADLQKTVDKLKGRMVVPGESKGKGGSAGSGTSNVGAAELQAAKSLYQERKTLLDGALKGELLSYADYAERMKNANELLYQSSLASAEKQVATIKNPGARAAALAEKKAAIRSEFEQTNAEIENQLDESNRKMLDAEDNLRADYAAKVGETAQAGYARIDQQYKKLREELLRNGREDGVKLVDERIAVEYADVRMKQLQQTMDKLNTSKEARLTGVDIAVSNGDISGRRAEVEKLAIEKEYAAERLKSLELTIAESERAGQSEKERVEYMKEALALKQQMNTVTETQRQLEEQASKLLADSIASLADGSIKSWKDAAKQIRSIYNRLVADMLQDQIKQAMAKDRNSSGSSLLGGLLNSAINGLMDFAGLGSGGGSTSSDIGPGAMSSMGTASPSWSAPSLGDMFSSSSSSQSTSNVMNITLNTQADNPLNTSFLQQAADAQRRMGLMAN